MFRIKRFLATLHHAFFNFVLNSFKSINRKIRSKLPAWRMREETKEHVQSSIKIFKWIILPASLLYFFLEFYFFSENALDTMLWGLAVFFYSNFLPDLPSIYRRKTKKNYRKDLPWYKRYAILLFAPLLVWILFSDIHLNWRTTETYHNFKSLTIYCFFLFIVGFFAFVRFPIQIGNLIEVLVFPFYGLAGYLTHLKVDKVW
ncbi:hypothetical protein KEJ37_02915 [Candidatus Bathyarchaeota archaeon]|nr:hypothetical protein [Candidatus Bathyarchaeota archaeon]